MPLPIGHAAIGLAVYEFIGKQTMPKQARWITAGAFALLANLPDIDMLIGLLVFGNGNHFHRGPTHSLLFALLAGFLISQSRRIAPVFQKLKFITCSSVVLSHVLADCALTDSPVSWFWPLQVHLSSGHSRFWDIVRMASSPGWADGGLVAGYMALAFLWRLRLKQWIAANDIRPVVRP